MTMFTATLLLLFSARLAAVQGETGLAAMLADVHIEDDGVDKLGTPPLPPPLTMKQVIRTMEDRPPVSETAPMVRVQLGRFNRKDGVSFRFDEDTGSVIVETPFNLRGRASSSQEVNSPEIIPVNATEGARTRTRGKSSDSEDGGSAPDHLPIHPAHPEAEPAKNTRAVFGVDDRIVFRDTSYPYSTTGRTSTGCTGTMVGRRHVLTAAHCISSSQMTFTPAYYDGDAPFGVATVSNILHWDMVNTEDGFTNDEVAFDYAVLVLDTYMGDLTGWVGFRTYNDGWNNGGYWDNIGYPSGLTGNQRPAFTADGAISSTQDFTSSNGLNGMLLGHFIDIEPGNSGGPLWGYWGTETFPRIVGVQSSESFNPAFTADGDNQAAGGPAMADLITYARDNFT